MSINDMEILKFRGQLREHLDYYWAAMRSMRDCDEDLPLAIAANNEHGGLLLYYYHECNINQFLTNRPRTAALLWYLHDRLSLLPHGVEYMPRNTLYDATLGVNRYRDTRRPVIVYDAVVDVEGRPISGTLQTGLMIDGVALCRYLEYIPVAFDLSYDYRVSAKLPAKELSYAK